MGFLSIAFLFLAWACSTVLGPVGFIVANCLNFLFRIVHNFYVIEKRQRELKIDLPSPVVGLIPTSKTLAAVLFSALVCKMSETYLYQAGLIQAVAAHLALGATCFLMTCLVVLFEEPVLWKFITNTFAKFTKLDKIR